MAHLETAYPTFIENQYCSAPAQCTGDVVLCVGAGINFPPSDLLNVEGIPPVMSSRDASLHGEIIEVMQRVAAAIGLADPTFSFRPLLTNHHTFGALRVGKAVTPEFRFRGLENLYVLPPTAFVDVDDDANPVLKSRVLAQFAMGDIARRWQQIA